MTNSGLLSTAGWAVRGNEERIYQSGASDFLDGLVVSPSPVVSHHWNIPVLAAALSWATALQPLPNSTSYSSSQAEPVILSLVGTSCLPWLSWTEIMRAGAIWRCGYFDMQMRMDVLWVLSSLRTKWFHNHFILLNKQSTEQQQQQQTSIQQNFQLVYGQQEISLHPWVSLCPTLPPLLFPSFLDAPYP